MSQKWTNLSESLLEDYHLHGESQSRLQNVTANDSQASLVKNQKNSSEHLIMPSSHYAIPADSTKKLCLLASDCSVSKNTSRDILEVEQAVGGHQNFNEKYWQNSCFVCLCRTGENNFVSIKESSKYSHTPLVVLLMDVLGYRLEMDSLHSKGVCRSCSQLIDTVDELEQTLTESKTDLRRKFLETFQNLKLKYPRTDKDLKTTVHVDSEVNYSNGFKNSESSENLYSLQENDVTFIYDTDPMFFSPDEKLKAAYMKSSDVSPVTFCCYCTAQYDSSLSIKMHVRVFHMPIIIYDNGQGTTGSRYRIGIKLQNISQNEKFFVENSYSCLFCHSSYKLEGSLQFHFRENHSPHKPYQCLECKEQFRISIELSRHKVYNCPLRKIETFENKD